MPTELEDVNELNKLQIPLAEVRMFVVDLMRDGHTEYPLGDFLLDLRAIYRAKQHDDSLLKPT